MKHNNKERNQKNTWIEIWDQNNGIMGVDGGVLGWMGWFGEKVEKILGKCIATSFNET